MRVLGVDPGLTRCGLGVVNGGVGRTISCVAVGVVRSPPEDELPDRLGQIADGVEQWLDEYRPDVVAIERVFSQHNVRSAMGTAQAGGVVALLAGRRGLPVRFHTPSEVKAAVTGSGRADKAQVTAMVTRLLRLDAPPKPADAADALALAICHLWRAPAADRLAGVKAESDRLAAAHRNRLSGARGKGSQSAPSSSERNGSSAPADHGVRATAPQAAPAAPQNDRPKVYPPGRRCRPGVGRCRRRAGLWPLGYEQRHPGPPRSRAHRSSRRHHSREARRAALIGRCRRHLAAAPLGTRRRRKR